MFDDPDLTAASDDDAAYDAAVDRMADPTLTPDHLYAA